MKKLTATLAVAALLLSASTFAQEVKKETKTAKKAKTEKTCTMSEKKACSTDKKACCAAKTEKKA